MFCMSVCVCVYHKLSVRLLNKKEYLCMYLAT